MIDREQLELAAKAAGIEHKIVDVTPCYRGDPNFESLRRTYHIARRSDWVKWNPLEDDGDVFRLAVKLRLLIQFTNSTVIVCDSAGNQLYMCGLKDDPYAATRRAIVRAAAEIGKGMNATDP